MTDEKVSQPASREETGRRGAERAGAAVSRRDGAADEEPNEPAPLSRQETGRRGAERAGAAVSRGDRAADEEANEPAPPSREETEQPTRSRTSEPPPPYVDWPTDEETSQPASASTTRRTNSTLHVVL